MTQSAPTDKKAAGQLAGQPDGKNEPGEKSKTESKSEGITSRSPVATSDGARSREVGGRDGPDPTRFGDWEKHGRCVDF